MIKGIAKNYRTRIYKDFMSEVEKLSAKELTSLIKMIKFTSPTTIHGVKKDIFISDFKKLANNKLCELELEMGLVKR